MKRDPGVLCGAEAYGIEIPTNIYKSNAVLGSKKYSQGKGKAANLYNRIYNEQNFDTVLAVGLGSDGDQYKNNRQNVGRLFVDYVSKKVRKDYEVCNEIGCEFFRHKFELMHENMQEVIFLKPQAQMTGIGDTVAAAFKHFKIERDPNNLIVFTDAGLNLGSYNIVSGTHFFGHKGLKSITKSIAYDFDGFTRINIGIDKPQNNDPTLIGRFFHTQLSDQEHFRLQKEVFPLIFNDHLRYLKVMPDPFIYYPLKEPIDIAALYGKNLESNNQYKYGQFGQHK